MDQQERETFGEFLRTARQAKGLTQRKAGELVGISGPYLAQLEKGLRSAPSNDVLMRLATVYGVAQDTLLERAHKVVTPPTRIPISRIEWAFETIRRDPDFAFGTRLRSYELNVETKQFLIELYERATGRHLLLEAEREELQHKESGNESKATDRI